MRGTTSLGACALALLSGVHLVVGPAAAQVPDQVTYDGPAPIETRFSAESAKVMRAEPGWYHATMQPAEVISFFRVERTLPNAEVTVGMLSRPTADEGGGHYLELALETSDGVVCEKESTWITGDSDPRLAQYVSLSSASPDLSAKQARKCAQEDRFVLAYGGSESDTAAAVDFLIHEEPPARNASELPEPASVQPWNAPSLPEETKSDTEIEAATHPLWAEPLDSGTYRTTLFSGEQVFFRVDADWGQSVNVHVRAGDPAVDGEDEVEAGGQYLAGQLIGPRFGNVLLSEDEDDDEERMEELSLSSPAELQLRTAEVRYRNRVADNGGIRNASMPGPYFLVLTMSDAGVGFELPIRLRLTVQGEPDPAPAYREDAVPIGPSWVENAGLSADDSENVSTQGPANTSTAALWLLGGGLLLLLAGIVTLLVLRRGAR